MSPAPAGAHRRALVTVAVVASVVAGLGVAATTVVAQPRTPASPSTTHLPAIRHVWTIMLENEDYASTFGDPKADPYLARTLPRHGALLEDYYATGHESNDNYVSIVSGQPPNPDNQGDCQVYAGFPAGSSDSNGIETGAGCIYPRSIKTIGNQLSAKGLRWKAYEQGMGDDPNRERAACGHPALNSQDKTQTAEKGDGYATRHNPFVYFDSVIDNQRYCDRHVVALGSLRRTMPAAALKHETGLATDLRSAKRTPAYSFITPNLCADGHDYPCKNESSGASALADIDTFLKHWVPKIEHSAAYRQGGLIQITFDESDGAQSDATACCGEQPSPGSPMPGISGPGGGKVGAVLLSPFITPGTRTTTAYNHYSTLATDERLFGLARLGDARTVTSTFGADVFTRPKARHSG